MHISIQLRYNANPDAVAQILADPEFVSEKASLMDAHPENVNVTGESDAHFTVVVRRSIPSDAIPSQVRPYIGNKLEIRQAEAWGPPQADHTRTGTVAVEIVGAPVRMNGTMRLDPVEGGTVQTYSGEIKAAIPLFGSAIENAAAETIRKVLENEEALVMAWIAR